MQIHGTLFMRGDNALAEKYFLQSTFHYAGNNPIGNIDIDGNQYTKTALDWVWKLVSRMEQNISSLDDKIDRLSERLQDGDLTEKKKNRVARRLNRKKLRRSKLTTEYTQVTKEIIALAKSSQTYNVVVSARQNESGPIYGTGTNVASTSFNFNTNEVDITISRNAGIGMFAHELLHAYQFDNGKISLGAAGSIGKEFLLDKYDEVEGYKRQGLFGRNENVTHINNLPKRYQDLPDGPNDIYNFSFESGGQKYNLQSIIQSANKVLLRQVAGYTKQAYRAKINGSWKTVTQSKIF